MLRFLNAIMYPYDEGFTDTISEYIDFSGNEELRKEENHMFSLAQCVWEDGMKEDMEEGIQAMVVDNLEENIEVAQKVIS